ncbi:MAG: hypothetical protein HQ580_00025 [Planctomycetes bacterium]|nr:hypothetical protein [Planctomycetota bacterium]
MKLQSIVLAVLSGFLVFTYQPPRPPVLNPDAVPFHYDPNLCLSEPLGYAVIPAGTTYENNFKVTEPEGNPVTISITTGQNIVIEPKPYFNRFDPNDSLGKCKIYRYRWRWRTTPNDTGLHYVNIRVTDAGGAYNERTFLVLVKENLPPAGIMGCHRR